MSIHAAQRKSRIIGPRASRASFDATPSKDDGYPLRPTIAHRPSIATISTVNSDDSDTSASPPSPSPLSARVQSTPPRRRQGSPYRSTRRRPLPILPSDIPPVPALPPAYASPTASPMSASFRRLPVLPAHQRTFSDVRVLPLVPDRSCSPEPRTTPPVPAESDDSDQEIDWDMIDEILGCAA